VTPADAEALIGDVSERPSVRARVWIALALVLAYAGVSVLRCLHRAAEWPSRAGQDEISAYERRFEALRPALPTRGVVGYLGDPEPNEEGALEHFRRYLLAQYSLAPLLVVENLEPEFVVGNFYPGTKPAAPPGFRLVRDFGDGLVLFRQTP
jgi:hypothetical protein